MSHYDATLWVVYLASVLCNFEYFVFEDKSDKMDLQEHVISWLLPFIPVMTTLVLAARLLLSFQLFKSFKELWEFEGPVMVMETRRSSMVRYYDIFRYYPGFMDRVLLSIVWLLWELFHFINKKKRNE